MQFRSARPAAPFAVPIAASSLPSIAPAQPPATPEVAWRGWTVENTQAGAERP